MKHNPFFWWACGFAVGVSFATSISYGHDLPREDSAGLTQWTPSRPDISLGHGPIIDDLESMSVGLGWDGRPHTMRNVADPGNWVHEMTHLVNAEFRDIMFRREKVRYNNAYVLNGFACSLPEPGVTLAQVSSMLPEEQQGDSYETYLVDARKWWNKQPLNILDEASAAANALYYQCMVKKVDQHRQGLCEEFINYSKALVTTVEKYDPNYQELGKLRAFVIWHNRRARHLIQDHKRLTNPYFIGEEK